MLTTKKVAQGEGSNFGSQCHICVVYLIQIEQGFYLGGCIMAIESEVKPKNELGDSVTI